MSEFVTLGDEDVTGCEVIGGDCSIDVTGGESLKVAGVVLVF